MKTDQPQRKYLNEYRKPDFTIETASLTFDLKDGKTRVGSRLTVHRQCEDTSIPLVLDGVGLKIIDLRVDDEYLDASDYRYDGNHLTIDGVPDRFEFRATVEIDPAANTRLEGLYQSNGVFCTQCEAEGFRHITFYIDRPDVMAVFDTTICADKSACPVMLSNGNKVDSGEKGDQHWVKWSDPFPKPCYLFALVAGDLACVAGQFTTMSGREIQLEFYTEHHNRDKCGHALSSLQNAMKWDEQTYGLEYDLDLYMVVAVDDFNMGAMENKGLNVFNTKYVLANPKTATDSDYHGIEGVIAHEYFHNWTGNRVTCRDWFQLSLKEGLTVFRDQEFSADMNSRAIQRINDVRVLRSHQFAEDAGPMAHPVRPSSYQEINNFYTVTVYDKGAEVVRMYQTLLGKAGFRKGMELYFKRHDGQAVTTDDFRMAMQDANDFNLDQFQRWYEQAGTPVVTVKRMLDRENSKLTLLVQQKPGKTKSEANRPFLIPMQLALFDAQGNKIALDGDGNQEQVLHISEEQHRIEFTGINDMPLLSVFREFSAPVIIETDMSLDELSALIGCDDDAFTCWDAAQQYATQVLLELINGGELTETAALTGLKHAYAQLLQSIDDSALTAEMLVLPGEKYLSELSRPVDVHRIHAAREFVKDSIAEHCESRLLEIYRELNDGRPYAASGEAIARRSLKNGCLAYLVRLHRAEYQQLASTQYEQADNMTDQLGALNAMLDEQGDIRDRMYAGFYEQWADTPLVVDKWFTLQASQQHPQALQAIRELENHPAFNLKNPNRIRSLLGPFQGNVSAFHAPGGAGYEFLADKILYLDSTNPQIASRMAHAFLGWRKFIPQQGELMRAQIERILAKPDLSSDVAELMQSSLEAEG
jgi:aminopeptidase N